MRKTPSISEDIRRLKTFEHSFRLGQVGMCGNIRRHTSPIFTLLPDPQVQMPCSRRSAWAYMYRRAPGLPGLPISSMHGIRIGGTVASLGDYDSRQNVYIKYIDYLWLCCTILYRIIYYRV